MKRDTVKFMALCLALSAIAIGAGLANVNAQGFGNLEAQLRHMADQETAKFMDALKVAFLTLDAPARTAFRNALVTELGLGGFATDQEKVEELLLIKKQLDAIADNAEALFADIVLNIQITPAHVEEAGP